MPRNVSELKSVGGGGGRVPPSPTDRRPCVVDSLLWIVMTARNETMNATVDSYIGSL